MFLEDPQFTTCAASRCQTESLQVGMNLMCDSCQGTDKLLGADELSLPKGMICFTDTPV